MIGGHHEEDEEEDHRVRFYWLKQSIVALTLMVTQLLATKGIETTSEPKASP